MRAACHHGPTGATRIRASTGGIRKRRKRVKRVRKQRRRRRRGERKRKRRRRRRKERRTRKQRKPSRRPLSWADDGQADTTAGWEEFTTTEKKAKKGKKGNEAGDEKKKAEEQAATVANPLAWADGGHADTDPAWATFGKRAKRRR